MKFFLCTLKGLKTYSSYSYGRKCLCSVGECTDAVASLLMRSGDVQSNPGSLSKTDFATDSGVRSESSLSKVMSVLQKLNTRSLKFDKGEAGLMKSVDEIKQNQEAPKAQLLTFA